MKRSRSALNDRSVAGIGVCDGVLSTSKALEELGICLRSCLTRDVGFSVACQQESVGIRLTPACISRVRSKAVLLSLENSSNPLMYVD